MKRIFLITILLVCFSILCSCNSLKKLEDSKNDSNPTTEESSNPESKSTANTIKDYFPFKENSKYTYEGKGNEYASYKMWVDYIQDNRVQLRMNNGGTETVKVIEYTDGELRLNFLKSECYYRENLTQKTAAKSEVLLKEPLIKGTSWLLDDGRRRYISNSAVEVTTPSGKYKALEVTTENGENKELDYYALETGLIKTIFNSKDIEVSSSLSKLEVNTPLIQNVKFFYPNAADSRIYFIQNNLTFNTNDITRLSFEKSFREAPYKALQKIISTNTKINSLYLGTDNIVYADFSKELVSEMNAGSGFEQMILQCITNTLGTYYGVNKVYITIENSPYSSGHIIKKKGEYFTVNTKNCIEFKK